MPANLRQSRGDTADHGIGVFYRPPLTLSTFVCLFELCMILCVIFVLQRTVLMCDCHVILNAYYYYYYYVLTAGSRPLKQK